MVVSNRVAQKPCHCPHGASVRLLLALLGMLILTAVAGRALAAQAPEKRSIPAAPARKIDPERLLALSLRTVEGPRLTLFTDLPLDDEIKGLPGLFEQAFPIWCEKYGVPQLKNVPCRMTVCLISDKKNLQVFRDAGLYPQNVPDFRNGYAIGQELWLFEQPTPYYRRHLLLHEGTHGFTETVFGGSGPPWYMEGMAEFMGTHSLNDGQLSMAVFPSKRDEAPRWGRIEIVRDEIKAGRGLLAAEIMNYDWRAHLDNRAYGWSWALAAFFDGHPRYRAAFREMTADLRDADFNRAFLARLGADAAYLEEDWSTFSSELIYGYDLARAAIDFEPGKPIAGAAANVTVAADRGWQSSRLLLEKGKTYRLQAKGRYQLGKEPRVWWCEPGGVTLRYWRGRPLGVLQAALRMDLATENVSSTERAKGGANEFVAPREIGLEGTITPDTNSILYFRVNDSPAELADNEGSVQVSISLEQGTDQHTKKQGAEK